MKVYAVICEYNPFHNGHKYLLDTVKENGDNAVISVMSGSFTQRGDIAIADKFTRAQVAVNHGADLVIELPTVYACAPAETFARGGVEIMKSLGIVDNLLFGAENDDLNLLTSAADAFENEAFNSEVKKNMDKGDNYPRALSNAAKIIYSPSLSQIIEKPNNILAVEYIKALRGSGIKPYAVKRAGAQHDSDKSSESIAGASLIRKKIINGEDYSAFVPDYTINNFAELKILERIILYKIRTMNIDDIRKLPDVSEGLENRIFEATKTAKSLDELFETIKTKRYTMARIRRIIIAALLNITSDLAKVDASYIRVLAFNDKGAKLLKEIKQRCPLPLITNVADGYNKLNDKAKIIFDVDILASDIFNLATRRIGECKDDFTKGIIKSTT